MSDTPGAGKPAKPGGSPGGFLGSLKDALAAASRDDTALAAKRAVAAATDGPMRGPGNSPGAGASAAGDIPARPVDASTPAPAPSTPLSAAEAAREARGVTSLKLQDTNMQFDGTNTTRMIRMPKTPEATAAPAVEDAPARTQLVRGRQAMKRGQFVSDPVVGWLVIVGGPGLGSYRPVFEGNNTIGRSPQNRIPLDFDDEAISAEEQAYLRYDSNDRSFLLVPNMSKTNIVSLNNTRPTTAVEIKAMDVITMGRTQLVFMPFCGPEFDWSEISESKD